jgi:hypothetical protein
MDTTPPTSDDAFAPMFRPGLTGTYQSDVFLRYDVSTQTLYVLVLTIPGVVATLEPEDAWVRIDDVKKVDGTDEFPAGSFEWVYIGDTLRGYEAKFQLGPEKEEYQINVHINVVAPDTDPGDTETSRILILIRIPSIIPEAAMLAVVATMAAAIGLFLVHKRRKP